MPQLSWLRESVGVAREHHKAGPWKGVGGGAGGRGRGCDVLRVLVFRQQVADPALAVSPARREALGTGQRRLSPGGQRRCRTVSWVPACTHSVDVGAQASPPVLARADFSTESQSPLQKGAGLPRCDCHGRRWDPRDADGRPFPVFSTSHAAPSGIIPSIPTPVSDAASSAYPRRAPIAMSFGSPSRAFPAALGMLPSHHLPFRALCVAPPPGLVPSPLIEARL